MATKKVLSIYVGNDAIRVAEVQYNGKTVVLSNAAEIPTPDNSVQDGYINDVTGVAEQIRQATFGRNFTTKDVIFTITSKKVASKPVTIPYNKNEKKLKQILNTNSSEYFPMSNSGDYCFAYSILDDFHDEEGHKCHVNAIAAPADLVRCYYELADELHFNVVSIDYYGNSVIQLLSMQMQPGHVELVLQIENDITFVNVMRGKTLVMQRSIPFGRTGVISALMDVKKISEKDAKTLLSNEMLLDQHVSADEYARSIDGLVSGIARAVEYHRQKNTSDVLEAIKIFGEGSAIAGIEKNLQAVLGAEVHHFQSLEGVSVKGAASLTAEEVLRYLANIGACIAPLGLSVGTSGSSGPSVDSKQVTLVGIAILAVATIASAAYSIKIMMDKKAAEEEQARLERQIEDIQDIVEISDAYELAKAKHTIVTDFVKSSHNDNEILLTLVEDMETLMPFEMYVTELTAENGEITLSMESGWHMPAKNEVADVIIKLQSLDYVSDFTIPDMEEEQRLVFVESLDEKGEFVYKRMEPQEGKAIGEIVSCGLDEKVPEGCENLYSIEQDQITFSVVFHIAEPVVEDAEASEEDTKEGDAN